MKEYDSLSDNEKRNMLASVANLYYNAEMTQNQIAERFFTSRSKISRMLKEARQLGIVEIKILEPWDRNIELEQEFMRRFALKDVRVISVKEANNTMVLQKLGEVAAYYLDNLLNDNMILGISWGNTMYHTVKAVKTSKNIPITVVPIMGAANVRTPERDSLDLSKELAYAYGGTYHYIYAPLFVNSEEVRDSLEQEPNIKGCLELARNADIILTSVGSIVYKSWKSYLSTRDLYNLVLQDIQELAKTALKDADAFYQRLSSRMERRYLLDASQTQKECQRLESRNREIDEMFLSLYTDKAKGILTEQRFMKLTATLEQEQEANQKRLQDLLLMMRHSDEQENEVRTFIKEIRRYATIEELDEAVLNRLISKILVSEVKKIDGQKVQEVRIIYNFVGEISMRIE